MPTIGPQAWIWWVEEINGNSYPTRLEQLEGLEPHSERTKN